MCEINKKKKGEADGTTQERIILIMYNLIHLLRYITFLKKINNV